MSTHTRRRFLRHSATLAALPLLPISRHRYAHPDSKIKGVQIGVITYSFRSMPDQSPEAVLGYVVDSGINAVELMGNHAEPYAGAPRRSFDSSGIRRLRRKRDNGGGLNEEETAEYDALMEREEAFGQEMSDWRARVDMAKFEELRQRYADAGVSIYAYKPRVFGKEASDADIDYGMRTAKALGASHVTLEHPGDDDHTDRLGKMAARHGMLVAYHGHTQQTPDFWDTALEQSDHNAMNIDVGHYVAAGYDDVLDVLRRKHERVASMHLKDRRSLDNGQANMPWGKGDTPIGDILQLMSREQYTFPATVELEYEIPEDSDAVREVARCLEYCRQRLEA